MFTGIIASRGSVVELHPHGLVLDAPDVEEELGASVAVDGCCLTVAASEPAPALLERWPGAGPVATQRLSFDVLPETLARTHMGTMRAGSVVNLEPALRAGQPLGGHLVQGHVDAVGTVRAMTASEAWTDLELEVPEQVLSFCVDRGSVTVNGVSLTVMELREDGIRVQLIPETGRRTNLDELGPGDPVNLEADVIARYVARLLPGTR